MFKIGITGQFLNQLQMRWNRKIPEKNRRNLELIQDCGFLYLCILYRISHNVSRQVINLHQNNIDKFRII